MCVEGAGNSEPSAWHKKMIKRLLLRQSAKTRAEAVDQLHQRQAKTLPTRKREGKDRWLGGRETELQTHKKMKHLGADIPRTGWDLNEKAISSPCLLHALDVRKPPKGCRNPRRKMRAAQGLIEKNYADGAINVNYLIPG